MGVCIYITYQIKKCVYNKKSMCIYVCVWGCFDKYISVATWPPQTKISSSAPESSGSSICTERWLEVHPKRGINERERKTHKL